jgi:hypothetical protein
MTTDSVSCDGTRSRPRRALASAASAVAARRRPILATLAAFFLLPWAYVELFTAPPGAVDLVPLSPDTRVRVYVVGWGYHTSIVVARPAEWRIGPEGAEDAPFVEYGWGDRSFMMESDYRPHSVFAALLLPTESVSYVCALRAPPSENPYAREVYTREIDAREATLLVTALEREMARPASGARPAAFPPVPEYLGRFYPARDYYIFWNDCNAWTVRMLASAGIGTSPAFVFGEWQVSGRLIGFTRLPGPERATARRSAPFRRAA